MNPKAYIGDSVYAEWDGYDITLTTNNGFGATNTIVLEPEVYASLIKLITKLRASPTDKTSEGVEG